MLQGRNFSYLDTQLKRLGSPNFTYLPINAPKCPFANFHPDGHMPMINPTTRAASASGSTSAAAWWPSAQRPPDAGRARRQRPRPGLDAGPAAGVLTDSGFIELSGTGASASASDFFGRCAEVQYWDRESALVT